MPFSLGGSISGGNFYNVEGNLSQTFNSQIVHAPSVPAITHSGSDDGSGRISQLSPANKGLIGPIRASRSARPSYAPYGSHPATQPASPGPWVNGELPGLRSSRTAGSRSTSLTPVSYDYNPHSRSNTPQNIPKLITYDDIPRSLAPGMNSLPHIKTSDRHIFSRGSNERDAPAQCPHPIQPEQGLLAFDHPITSALVPYRDISASRRLPSNTPRRKNLSDLLLNSESDMILSGNVSTLTPNSTSEQSDVGMTSSKLTPTQGIPRALGPPMDSLQRIETASSRDNSQVSVGRPHPVDAQQPPLNGGHNNNFTVHGNMSQIHITSHGKSGLDILYRSVAISAVYDSWERFPEPACHPGTRTQVLGDLAAWSVETNPGSSLLWLSGCAGIGKSAVAQAFAGDCERAGRLGASFFFRRGHPERGTWHRLFATLAHQLARSVPNMRLPIQATIENDDFLISRTMELQFRKLILEPFKQAVMNRNTPTVIVIDGLDECEDYKTQERILRLWIEAINTHELLLRILIVSRPEAHLREVMHVDMNPRIRHLELSAGPSADADIRLYLHDEFSKLFPLPLGSGS